jgi:2',3'-cyclic-nucleotide 2'-phosphodiesterase
MKIALIGDIVGKPGRLMIEQHLSTIRQAYGIDFVIANGENASHGFGLTKRNLEELLSYGVDLLTGGNHSFDKKEIAELFGGYPVIRPDNYPKGVAGQGYYITEGEGQKLAVINLLGEFSMPSVDNPFRHIQSRVKELKEQGIKNIVIDFHAETTAEKRTLLEMLKGEVSAIMGTHTHIGTDDLSIESETCYVTDVGLSGCRDGVIGMEPNAPIKSALSAIKQKFDIPKECKRILQMVVFEIEEGVCFDAYKLKVYDDQEPFVSQKALVD